MQLNEIFGRKKPVKAEVDPAAEEAAFKRRIAAKLSGNDPVGEVIDKRKDVNPMTLSPEEFGEWHGKALKSQGSYSSIGPEKGDLIMSHKGPLEVVDPNGGGNMVATVKQGDMSAKVSWNKLSKPVKKGNKQYYAYG